LQSIDERRFPAVGKKRIQKSFVEKNRGPAKKGAEERWFSVCNICGVGVGLKSSRWGKKKRKKTVRNVKQLREERTKQHRSETFPF